MELKNCPSCGKVFQKTRGDYCKACMDALEEDYIRVREFLKQYPKSAMETVVEATGVDEQLILQFLREGRIEFSDDVYTGLECRKCGAPIYRGEYCVICSNELQNAFKPAENRSRHKKLSKDDSQTFFTRRYRNTK